jgi:hypothetical protein
MLSDLGDGTQSATYDIMPGAIASASRPKVRAGAGLTTGEVDVDAWEDLLNSPSTSKGYPVGIETGKSLISLLRDDICPLLGAYLYVTRNGKLSVRSYQSVSSALTGDYTADDDVLLSEDSNTVDESKVIASIRIKSDYDWRSEEYLRQDIATYYESWRLYGDTSEPLEIASRISGRDFQDVNSVFGDFISRWGQPVETAMLSLPMSACLLEPGDKIAVTNSRVPDWRGDTGQSAVVYEVTGIGLDIGAGRVRIQAMRVETSELLSPTGRLGSNISGDNWNATNIHSPNSLDDDFAVGWRVRFFSKTSGTPRVATNAYATISAVTSSTITFTSPPTDIIDGDIFIIADESEVSALTQQNSSESATPSNHLHLTDSDTNPSGSTDRW